MLFVLELCTRRAASLLLDELVCAYLGEGKYGNGEMKRDVVWSHLTFF
jgi:hypothetical protein